MVPERDRLGRVPEHLDADGDAADCGGEFMRIRHGARDGDLVERIAEPRGGLDVLERGIAAIPSEGVHPRGFAGDGIVIAPPDAEGGSSGQVAAIDRELFAGLLDAAEDKFLRDSRALRRAVHRGACSLQAVEHVGMRDGDADALQQRHRTSMNAEDLIFIQHMTKHRGLVSFLTTPIRNGTVEASCKNFWAVLRAWPWPSWARWLICQSSWPDDRNSARWHSLVVSSAGL